MKYILVSLIVGIVFTGQAQKPTDTELWTGGQVQFRLSKPFSMGITQQFRFKDTISSLDKSFTELDMKYRLGKRWSLRGNYRYVMRPERTNQHRFALDLGYSFDKKGFPLIFDYRLRGQYLLGGNRTYVRNKFGLTYKMSKLVDPYVAYEAFFRLDGKNEFRTNRYTVGLDWRLAKPLHLNTFFRVEDGINVKDPERQRIIGLTLNYKINLRK